MAACAQQWPPLAPAAIIKVAALFGYLRIAGASFIAELPPQPHIGAATMPWRIRQLAGKTAAGKW